LTSADGIRTFVRAHPVLVSTPLLGTLLAALTWPGGTSLPGLGIDPSWQLGLQMATQRGLDFGTEVIWTYGPLGFLQVPTLADGGLWTAAAVYAGLVHIALCASLVWAARRSVIGLLALPVMVLLLDSGQMESSVIVALIWSVAALDRSAPSLARRLVLFAGPVFAAIELLGKTNRGVTVLALLVVSLLAVDNRRRNLPLFGAIFAAAFAFFWAVTGQSFSEISQYVSQQAEIISGYAEALAVEDAAVDWERRVAPLAIAALFVLALRPRRHALAPERIGVASLIAIFAYMSFKEGFVRHDAGHGAVFFTSLAVGLYAVAWRARQDAIAAAAATLLATAALASLPANIVHSNPIEHLRGLSAEIHALVSSARREALAGEAKAALREGYGVGARALRLIGDRPVHVDPWEIATAWAYDLKWDPLPVFQDEQAYTEGLQQANVDALESAQGPQRILRENTAAVEGTYPTGAIDHKLGSFDPPRASIAMICNFEPLDTSERWEVLGRIPDRCGHPRRLGASRARTGDVIPVPKAGPGELVVARIDGAQVQGLEELRALLYRSHGRTISVNGVTYGLDPGTAASGLLLRAPVKVDFPGRFAVAPQADTISLSILKGPAAALEVEFEAIPIRAATDAPARP
jgi:phage tail protein X